MIALLLLAVIEFQAMTDDGATVLLLKNEAVLSGVVIRGDPKNLAISQDAITWITVAFTREGDEIRFAPTPARAVRIEGVEVIRLIAAEGDRIRVSDIKTESITENFVVVKWKTSFPVKTALLYGAREGEMRPCHELSSELRTDHEARLTGLLPGIDYKYWILLSKDHAIGPKTFRTAGIPLPFASDPIVSVGRDTATLKFSTNIPARAELEGDIAGSSREGREHRVALAGLEPRKTYRYQIVATDARGRATATPAYEFTTAPFNLALEKTGTGTFIRRLADQTAGGATDGRYDYFEGMVTSGDPSETDQWIEVDLGRAEKIETIETIWRGNAYPKDFYVLTSLDHENWSYAGFNLDAATGSTERSERGDPLLRIVTPASDARYIRIFIPKGSPTLVRSRDWDFVQLAEIEAHGVWKGR